MDDSLDGYGYTTRGHAFGDSRVSLTSVRRLTIEGSAGRLHLSAPQRASVDTSKPAICGRGKTGHFRAAETGEGLPRGLFLAQVGMDLGAPASWPAPEDVRVMEEAVQECGDGRGVSKELAPVIDGTV
jgi:hypothetical protein